MSVASITLVTVTYGNRIEMLARLLDCVLTSEDVASAVIVSNASTSPLHELTERWGDRVRIIENSSNLGSAIGYSMGIDAAVKGGAEYLFLMDDDNIPTAGALQRLMRGLQQFSDERGKNKTAVLGFRLDHQPNIAQGFSPRFAFPAESSFLGFDIRDIPFKLWRRTPWGKTAHAEMPEYVSMPFGPYGGMLAHHSMFEVIGLPKADFVLYSDDTEYTLRLTQAGGVLMLNTAARIDDQEASWNDKKRRANSFLVNLREGTAFRIYYSLRNRVWLDRYRRCSNILLYTMNKFAFISLLCAFARTKSDWKRIHLILRSIRDGERATLGICSDFPLPQ